MDSDTTASALVSPGTETLLDNFGSAPGSVAAAAHAAFSNIEHQHQQSAAVFGSGSSFAFARAEDEVQNDDDDGHHNNNGLEDDNPEREAIFKSKMNFNRKSTSSQKKKKKSPATAAALTADGKKTTAAAAADDKKRSGWFRIRLSIDDLREIKTICDKHGAGGIDPDDFRKKIGPIARRQNPALTDRDLNLLFEFIDANDSSSVDWDEISMFLIRNDEMEERRLTAMEVTKYGAVEGMTHAVVPGFEIQLKMLQHRLPVQFLLVHPEMPLVYSATKREVKIWKTDMLRHVRTPFFSPRQDLVSFVSLAPAWDDALLVVGHDCTVTLFNSQTGDLLQSFVSERSVPPQAARRQMLRRASPSSKHRGSSPSGNAETSSTNLFPLPSSQQQQQSMANNNNNSKAKSPSSPAPTYLRSTNASSARFGTASNKKESADDDSNEKPTSSANQNQTTGSHGRHSSTSRGKKRKELHQQQPATTTSSKVSTIVPRPPRSGAEKDSRFYGRPSAAVSIGAASSSAAALAGGVGGGSGSGGGGGGGGGGGTNRSNTGKRTVTRYVFSAPWTEAESRQLNSDVGGRAALIGLTESHDPLLGHLMPPRQFEATILYDLCYVTPGAPKLLPAHVSRRSSYPTCAEVYVDQHAGGHKICVGLNTGHGQIFDISACRRADGNSPVGVRCEQVIMLHKAGAKVNKIKISAALNSLVTCGDDGVIFLRNLERENLMNPTCALGTGIPDYLEAVDLVTTSSSSTVASLSAIRGASSTMLGKSRYAMPGFSKETLHDRDTAQLGHGHGVIDFDIHEKLRIIISYARSENDPLVWSPFIAKPLARLDCTTGVYGSGRVGTTCSGVAFNQSEPHVTVMSSDGMVRVFDVRALRCLQQFDSSIVYRSATVSSKSSKMPVPGTEAYEQASTAAATAQSATSVASATEERQQHQDAEDVFPATDQTERPGAVVVDPHRCRVVTATRHLYAYPVISSSRKDLIDGHSATICNVHTVNRSDLNFLVTYDKDDVFLWDSAGSLVVRWNQALQEDDNGARRLAETELGTCDANERRLILTTHDGRIDIINMMNGYSLRKLLPPALSEIERKSQSGIPQLEKLHKKHHHQQQQQQDEVSGGGGTGSKSPTTAALLVSSKSSLESAAAAPSSVLILPAPTKSLKELLGQVTGISFGEQSIPRKGALICTTFANGFACLYPDEQDAPDTPMRILNAREPIYSVCVIPPSFVALGLAGRVVVHTLEEVGDRLQFMEPLSQQTISSRPLLCAVVPGVLLPDPRHSNTANLLHPQPPEHLGMSQQQQQQPNLQHSSIGRNQNNNNYASNQASGASTPSFAGSRFARRAHLSSSQGAERGDADRDEQPSALLDPQQQQQQQVGVDSGSGSTAIASLSTSAASAAATVESMAALARGRQQMLSIIECIVAIHIGRTEPTMLTGTGAGTIHVWDIRRQQECLRFLASVAFGEAVTCMSLHSTSHDVLVVGDACGYITVFDVSRVGARVPVDIGERSMLLAVPGGVRDLVVCMSRFRAHTSSVASLSLACGGYLVSASASTLAVKFSLDGTMLRCFGRYFDSNKKPLGIGAKKKNKDNGNSSSNDDSNEGKFTTATSWTGVSHHPTAAATFDAVRMRVISRILDALGGQATFAQICSHCYFTDPKDERGAKCEAAYTPNELAGVNRFVRKDEIGRIAYRQPPPRSAFFSRLYYDDATHEMMLERLLKAMVAGTPGAGGVVPPKITTNKNFTLFSRPARHQPGSKRGAVDFSLPDEMTGSLFPAGSASASASAAAAVKTASSTKSTTQQQKQLVDNNSLADVTSRPQTSETVAGTSKNVSFNEPLSSQQRTRKRKSGDNDSDADDDMRSSNSTTNTASSKPSFTPPALKTISGLSAGSGAATGIAVSTGSKSTLSGGRNQNIDMSSMMGKSGFFEESDEEQEFQRRPVPPRHTTRLKRAADGALSMGTLGNALYNSSNNNSGERASSSTQQQHQFMTLGPAPPPPRVPVLASKRRKFEDGIVETIQKASETADKLRQNLIPPLDMFPADPEKDEEEEQEQEHGSGIKSDQQQQQKALTARTTPPRRKKNILSKADQEAASARYARLPRLTLERGEGLSIAKQWRNFLERDDHKETAHGVSPRSVWTKEVVLAKPQDVLSFQGLAGSFDMKLHTNAGSSNNSSTANQKSEDDDSATTPSSPAKSTPSLYKTSSFAATGGAADLKSRKAGASVTLVSQSTFRSFHRHIHDSSPHLTAATAAGTSNPFHMRRNPLDGPTGGPQFSETPRSPEKIIVAPLPAPLPSVSSAGPAPGNNPQHHHHQPHHAASAGMMMTLAPLTREEQYKLDADIAMAAAAAASARGRVVAEKTSDLFDNDDAAGAMTMMKMSTRTQEGAEPDPTEQHHPQSLEEMLTGLVKLPYVQLARNLHYHEQQKQELAQLKLAAGAKSPSSASIGADHASSINNNHNNNSNKAVDAGQDDKIKVDGGDNNNNNRSEDDRGDGDSEGSDDFSDADDDRNEHDDGAKDGDEALQHATATKNHRARRRRKRRAKHLDDVKNMTIGARLKALRDGELRIKAKDPMCKFPPEVCAPPKDNAHVVANILSKWHVERVEKERPPECGLHGVSAAVLAGSGNAALSSGLGASLSRMHRPIDERAIIGEWNKHNREGPPRPRPVPRPAAIPPPANQAAEFEGDY